MISRWAGMFVLGTMVVLSGCATMSADECETSDWRGIGYDDGVRGYSADRIGRHRNACAKHGVTPDLDAYQTGRTEGLREYCQPQRGFNLGANGSRYNGVCAADLEPNFLDAYRLGSELYSLRAQVSAATAAISEREHELEDVAAALHETEAVLIASETTVQDRILLLVDLKELAERSGELETEIAVLLEDRGVHRAQLADFEAHLSAEGY